MELFDPRRGCFVTLKTKGLTVVETERSALRARGPTPSQVTTYGSGWLAEAAEAVRADELRAAGLVSADDPSVEAALAGLEPFRTWAALREDRRRLVSQWSWAPAAAVEALLALVEAVEPPLTLVFPKHVLEASLPLDEAVNATAHPLLRPVYACHAGLTLTERRNEDIAVQAGMGLGPADDAGTPFEGSPPRDWFLARGDETFWIATGEGLPQRFELDGGVTRESEGPGAIILREFLRAIRDG